jgi:predicted histidine transporter YuiF (NhaC family)
MDTEISLIAKQWWWRMRLKYNMGLVIAGFIAFLLYCILGPIIIAPHEEFEETIFEMAFQGFAYLIMMGIANIFYTLGWMIDSSYNTSNSQLFRKRLFWLGYWFSFALPILLILSIMVRFLIWGK